MEIIRSGELNNALSQTYRLYLTGHLERPQPNLTHFDDNIEVGISSYSEFTADTPHFHPIATEHNYVLCGKVRIKLLDGSGNEYEFQEGDFFLLRSGIPYVSKNQKNTKVLFIKSPSINDKTLVEVDDETKEWMSVWDYLK